LEAKSLSTFLDRHVRAIELADLEARLEKLEKQAEAAKDADQ